MFQRLNGRQGRRNESSIDVRVSHGTHRPNPSNSKLNLSSQWRRSPSWGGRPQNLSILEGAGPKNSKILANITRVPLVKFLAFGLGGEGGPPNSVWLAATVSRKTLKELIDKKSASKYSTF